MAPANAVVVEAAEAGTRMGDEQAQNGARRSRGATRDIDVRRALHKKVLADHHDDPDTLVLDELGLWYGVARVDIAVVNGRIHGFEIKSDRDTLLRLPGQVKIYNAVLDRVTIVVGEKHLAKVSEMVPEWWGVKVATAGPRGAVHFHDSRPPVLNPALDPIAVAALLWCEELIDVLERANAARGVRGKSRDVLSRRLAESMPLSELRNTVRACLKAREKWRCEDGAQRVGAAAGGVRGAAGTAPGVATNEPS